MLNPELEKYLRECKTKNITFDQIAVVLSNNGYLPEIINQAREWYIGQPDITSMPSLQTAPISNGQPKTRPKLRLLFFIIACIILLPLFFLTFVYVIATEKVKLSNPQLTKQVSAIYYSLPGISKPPKIVIEQAVAAHQQVKKNSFDLSVSISGLSSSISSIFGNNNLDLSLKGFVDYSKVENPKFTLSFFLGKDLNIEIRKKDNNIYVQIPKIPVSLYVMLGLEPDKIKPILENWVSIDTTPLQTEANKKISEMKKQDNIQSQTQKTTEEILTKLLDKNILPLLTISSDNLEGKSVYKIQFKPTAQQLDAVVESLMSANKTNSNFKSDYKAPKSSDYIKDLEILAYIGKIDSYVYRMDVSFRFDSASLYPNSTGSVPIVGGLNQTDPISIAGVLKLSDFKADMPIDIPSQSLTLEQFYQQIYNLQPGGLLGALNPTGQVAKARNAKRKADINMLLAAIEQYKVDNNKYPLGLTANPQKISKKEVDLCNYLIPKYITTLPIDPSLKEVKIADCQSEYDTGYTIMYEPVLEKVVLLAPLAEESETISVPVKI